MAESPSRERCPNCGDMYKSVGRHWAGSPTCGYPDLPHHVRDVLTGLLLTGGTPTRHDEDSTPFVRYSSTDRAFLRWVRDQLGVFAGSIRETDGGGFNEDHWDTVYEFTTKANPEYTAWLGRWRTSDDERRVPNDVTISPQGLRVAYAGAGRIREVNGTPRATLALTRANPSERAVQSAFDGYSPRRIREEDTIRVVLRDAKGFFDDIGWDAPSFAADQWPDRDFEEPPDQCLECNGRFISLGHHWHQSGCEPALSDEQESLLRALLAGGVPFSMSSGEEGPSLRLRTTNHAFVDYAEETLDWLVASRRVTASGEEASENFSRLKPTTESVDAKEIQQLWTRTHPQIAAYKQQIDAGTFEDQLLDEGVDDQFYRALFAFRGTTLPSENGTPLFSVTKWRLSDAAIEALFDPFDGTLQRRPENDLRTVRIRAPERLFEVIGREPVPGCENRWGPHAVVTP